jgi:glycosyltransferase involved in cell wall biosynthesis
MDVGVVIPAFNAAPYVAQAIESVLVQTVPPSRIVVVDDGSVDETAMIVERFGRAVTCVRQQNRGVAAARNRGAREAGTEWVAFLDADDVWLPTKLERQGSRVRNSGAAAVFTAVALVAEDLSPIPRGPVSDVRDDLEALLLHGETIPQGTSSTLLVRYSIFSGVGGYDETLSTMADWDLLIRLRLRTRFAHVWEPLVLYRRGTMSRNVELLEHDSIRILEKVFASLDIPPTVRGLRRRCLAWNDLMLSGSYRNAGSYSRAVKLAVRSVLRDPTLAGRILGFPYRHLRGRWSGQAATVLGHDDHQGGSPAPHGS